MELIEHLQMANWPRGGACAAVAYFIGCFTTGYYLVRMRTGKDIRETGSGSAGAPFVYVPSGKRLRNSLQSSAKYSNSSHMR